MWWIYFDFQGGADPRGGRWAFVSAYGHVVLWMSLAAYGAGVRLAIEHADAAAEVAGARWALAGSAAVFLLILTRVPHGVVAQRARGDRASGAWAASALLVALAAGGGTFPVVTLVILVALLLVAAMMLEAVSMRDSLRSAVARALSPPQRRGAA